MSRTTFLIAVLVLASSLSSAAQATTQAFSFEGLWASNVHETGGTKESTFLSVTKTGPNQYVVVSVSNFWDRYTYVAGGYLRDDGVLIFRTDRGDTWTLAVGYSRGGKDSIGLSTEKLEDELETYVRIAVKLQTWPKEWLSPPK